MAVQIFLGIIILLLVILIFLFVRRQKIRPEDVGPAISDAWVKSGLSETIGKLKAYAEDIRNDYKTLDQLLRTPKERGSLGEIALEQILRDQLPPDMFGIREKVLDGKTPDAYIKSAAGIICIDSKFPLDNYRKMLEAEATHPEEKENLKKQFLKNVESQLDKIAKEYVCPDRGSAEFAFAFIPSEGVYYFLVNEAYELLRQYGKEGVQVVSPLTLSHKIELIKAGVHARKLSEQAEKVRNDIFVLRHRFDEIDREWRVLYETHLRNAGRKAEDLDRAYKRLREEFARIATLSEEQNRELT
jgi:DNA recombination protein RmuC